MTAVVLLGLALAVAAPVVDPADGEPAVVAPVAEAPATGRVIDLPGDDAPAAAAPDGPRAAPAEEGFAVDLRRSTDFVTDELHIDIDAAVGGAQACAVVDGAAGLLVVVGGATAVVG